jgi:hypothetical protein
MVSLLKQYYYIPILVITGILLAVAIWYFPPGAPKEVKAIITNKAQVDFIGPDSGGQDTGFTVQSNPVQTTVY